jgi:hypothetical protein
MPLQAQKGHLANKEYFGLAADFSGLIPNACRSDWTRLLIQPVPDLPRRKIKFYNNCIGSLAEKEVIQ